MFNGLTDSVVGSIVEKIQYMRRIEHVFYLTNITDERVSIEVLQILYEVFDDFEMPKSEVDLSSTLDLLNYIILRDTPHKVWVCVLKSDHTIKTAHCSCMAGMSATCNHVAALLFRVEAAVRYGLTNPSCTAKSCECLPNRQEVDLVIHLYHQQRKKYNPQTLSH